MDSFEEQGEYKFWSKEYRKIFERAFNENSWHALTGCCLKTVSRIFELALSEDLESDTFSPLQVLLLLSHVKNYMVVRNGAQFFHISDDYYQNSIRRVLKDLMKSEDFKEYINWNNGDLDGFLSWSNGIFIRSIIDGFPCYVYKTDNCFSGKEHDYVYCYLIIVLLSGRILYWYGPYEGKSNDLTLLDESNFLKENFTEDSLEYILGDEIFASRPHMIYIKHNSSFDSEGAQRRNTCLAAWRSKVENVIAQIKSFSFAKSVYRGHSMEEHGMFMNLIFVLVNLNLIYRRSK